MAAPSRCLPLASPGAEAAEEPLALVPWLQGRCCACRIQFCKKIISFLLHPEEKLHRPRRGAEPTQPARCTPCPERGSSVCAERRLYYCWGENKSPPGVTDSSQTKPLLCAPGCTMGPQRREERLRFLVRFEVLCSQSPLLLPLEVEGGRFALPPPCRVPTGAGATPRVLRLRCFLGEKRFQGLSPASLGGERCGSGGEGEVKKGLEKQKKEAKTQGVFGPEPREPLSLGSRLDARPRAALGTECGCSRFTPGPSVGRGPGGCGDACGAEIRVGAWEDKVLRSRWRAASLGAGGCF